MGWLWILVTVVGVAALIGATLYAWLNNKNAPDRTIRKAERGAREVRHEIEQDEEKRGV